MIVWLASELMFFAGLFGIYFTVRAQIRRQVAAGADANWTSPTRWSSRSCWWRRRSPASSGVFAAERGDVFALRRWYLLTLVMGTIFVLGQANEYHTLVTEHETTIAVQRLRHRLLPDDRLPRPACHRRADRLRLPAHRAPRSASSRPRRPPARSSCRTTGTSSTWSGSGCSPSSTSSADDRGRDVTTSSPRGPRTRSPPPPGLRQWRLALGFGLCRARCCTRASRPPRRSRRPRATPRCSPRARSSSTATASPATAATCRACRSTGRA